MRVLLSEGSGLTARQCATVLSAAGHTVEALSSEPLCLCRFTRHVRRIHRVPAFGADPFGWLDAALAVYARGGFEVLLPTQEQVAVLAAVPDRLRSAGVRTAVPPFAAVVRVQDKVSAAVTLRELGLPQPEFAVLTSAEELAAWRGFPVYLKTPIGTASTGVCRLDSAADLAALPRSWTAAAVLAQKPVEGRLVMAQSVFDDGRLVAFHANARIREGVRGGASHKCGLDLPAAHDHVAGLGRRLRWHGALSADLILGPDGPWFIDINPRLVEPVNALRSGVDLVGVLLAVARREPAPTQPPAEPGIATHQLLLALLGAAERRARRRDVAAEILAALGHRGVYRDSVEELTPRLRRDPRSAALLGIVAAATLLRPQTWTWFAGGAVTAYALTPDSWSRILDT